MALRTNRAAAIQAHGRWSPQPQPL